MLLNFLHEDEPLNSYQEFLKFISVRTFLKMHEEMFKKILFSFTTTKPLLRISESADLAAFKFWKTFFSFCV